jgi:hypothetical protein
MAPDKLAQGICVSQESWSVVLFAIPVSERAYLI